MQTFYKHLPRVVEVACSGDTSVRYMLSIVDFERKQMKKNHVNVNFNASSYRAHRGRTLLSGKFREAGEPAPPLLLGRRTDAVTHGSPDM